MSTEIPSAIQLIQQWLHENGYPNTLKEFETECALDFVEDDVQMGGHLETILSEYADFKNAASVTDTQKEGKRSLEKLLEPGAGDYVKKGTASFANIHKANVLSVAFNHDPENLYMASGSTDKTIKLFTIPKQDDSSFTPEILAEFTAHTGAVISLDFNPKFKNLLLSSSMDGTVSVTDVTSKNVLQTFVNHSKYVVQVKWHSDGLTFACASHDHSASIYKKDETEGVYKLVEKIPFNGNVEALAFSNDGKLVMSVRDDNYLQIYDLATSTKTKFNMNAKGDDHVSFTALHMQFSPDGEYLLVNTDKDRLILYSMSSGSVPVRNFYGANNDIYSQPRCCWHLSGKYVYSTSQDNKIYCWDVATQKVVTRLEGHKGVVRDLTQHPTLNMIGSSSFDKTIKLWSQ